VLYEDDVDRAVAAWLKSNMAVESLTMSLGDSHGIDVHAVLADGKEVRIEAKGEGSQRPGTRRYGQSFTNKQHESHFSRALRKALVERGRGHFSGVALPDHPRMRALQAELPDDLAIAWFWVRADLTVEPDLPSGWPTDRG
jgi:hypothetical protein